MKEPWREFWRDLSPAIALGVFGVIALGASFAFGAESDRLRDQVIAPVAQLNRDCSATFIHSAPNKRGEVETYLLTAKHCVTNSGRVQTVYVPVQQNGRIVREDALKAKVHGSDFRSDLALLQLLDTETVIPYVAKIGLPGTVIHEGDPAWTVGYPRGEDRTVTNGLFGGITSIPFPSPGADTEYLRATPQVAGGNSGGALFRVTRAGNYRLVGVISALVPQSDFMTYSTPLADIRAYLGTALRDFFEPVSGSVPKSRPWGE